MTYGEVTSHDHKIGRTYQGEKKIIIIYGPELLFDLECIEVYRFVREDFDYQLERSAHFTQL